MTRAISFTSTHQVASQDAHVEVGLTSRITHDVMKLRNLSPRNLDIKLIKPTPATTRPKLHNKKVGSGSFGVVAEGRMCDGRKVGARMHTLTACNGLQCLKVRRCTQSAMP